jgi:hypothetical protein
MFANIKLIRVVTNRTRLISSRPGDAGFWDRVQETLSAWEAELARQKLRAELVLTDELSGGGRCDEARRIRRHLFALRNQQKADYTLILGGDSIVPFYRLPDPVMEMVVEADFWARENDRLIYSDDPYVSADDLLFRPEQPVARFPNGDGQQDDLLIELLDRSTRHHRAGWDRVCRIAFTTQSWRAQSHATWPGIGFWYDCPPWRLPSPAEDANPECRITPGLLADKTLHYYNLHGWKNSGWMGECDCAWLANAQENGMKYVPCRPPAVNIDVVPHLPAAVVFSAACYGGFITRPRPAQNLALRFLRQGAVAYVGATARSYTAGPIPGQEQPLRYSDLLAQTFFELIEENQARTPGWRMGEIVQTMKNDYHLTYRFFQQPLDFKSLWEFVLYGDPTLIPFGQIVNGESVHGTHGQ